MSRPGALRQRITIQSATESVDAHGQSVETWADAWDTWARGTPAPGSEIEQGEHISSQLPVDWLMRYRAALTTKHRIVYKGRVFGIESIQALDTTDTYMKVRAREMV